MQKTKNKTPAWLDIFLYISFSLFFDSAFLSIGFNLKWVY